MRLFCCTVVSLALAGCPEDEQPESAVPSDAFDAAPELPADVPVIEPDAPDAPDAEPPPNLDDVLRINHLQLRGTHNSYHVEPQFPVSPSHEYSHPPLDKQLEDLGIRAFELDLHLHDGELRVYHLSFVDEVSTCDTLPICLKLVVDWSAEHPRHLPVIVWLEVKDQFGGDPVDDLSIIDDVVRAAVPTGQLLTPDDVRGDYPTLREALDGPGWPTLADSRGKLLFVLLNGGLAQDYAGGDGTLAGQALFPRADEDTMLKPWAGFTKAGVGDTEKILAASVSRVLIAGNTCNADESAGTCEKDLLNGLKNGLTMVMDDFPGPVESTDYYLRLPNGALARCNPLTAPPQCEDAALTE